MRLNEMFEEFGPERYPGVIPLGKYLSNDEHEFAPPGDYRDSIELIRAVQELIAAGVGPDIVPADPKQLLATQDWLSNDRGAGALFDEYEDRPVVYEIDGEFYVLDGHHRVTAALKKNRPISVYLFSNEPDDDELGEGRIDNGIEDVLKAKGYRFLGAGMDQDVYLAPDGTVLKIFGYSPDTGRMSEGQKSFVDFARFCKANPDNPFLPNILDYARFEFEGENYLQIRMERLFSLSSKYPRLGNLLEGLVIMVMRIGANDSVDKFLDFTRNAGIDGGELIMHVGDEDDFLLLARTIERLADIARQHGYGLDLHSGNFMLGEDGQIVINDPFYTGGR